MNCTSNLDAILLKELCHIYNLTAAGIWKSLEGWPKGGDSVTVSQPLPWRCIKIWSIEAPSCRHSLLACEPAAWLCNWQLDCQVWLAPICYSFLPGITGYNQVFPSIPRWSWFIQIEDWTETHLVARICSLPPVPEIRGLYSWLCWIQIRSDFLPTLDCHGQSTKSRSE